MPPVDQSIPYGGDLVGDPADRELYDFLTIPARVDGAIVVSDKTSKAQVEELRHAFDLMAADPKFLTDARKTGLPIAVRSGAEEDGEIARLYATPPQILQRAKAVLTPQ